MMSDKNLLEKIRELIPKIPDRQVREMVTEFVRVLDLRVDEIAALRDSLAAAQRERDEVDALVSTLTGYDGDEDAIFALRQAIDLTGGEHISDIIADRNEASLMIGKLKALIANGGKA